MAISSSVSKSMREAIEQKLKSLKFLDPQNPEFKQWLRESNIWMLIYSVLRVQGIEMNKRQLVDVLQGKIVEDLPLNLYGQVHRGVDLCKKLQTAIDMQQNPDTKALVSWYRFYMDGEDLRKSNPFIYKWGYIAPHFNEIPERLSELFKPMAALGNPIDEAVRIHNGICRIYPFGEDTPAMALIAAFYVLMKSGYPVPAISVDVEEYDSLMAEEFAKNSGAFGEMLERCILNRLEQVVQIALSAGDKE